MTTVADPAESTRSEDLVRGLAWSLWATFLAAAYLVPYRIAVESAPRYTAMTAMFIVATVFNAGVAAVSARTWAFDRTAVIAAVVLAVLTFFGNLGTAYSLPAIGAGMTSVVLKAQVVLTPVISYWALKERMSGRFWLGAILALVGVALPSLAEGQGWAGASGYAWAFMSAVGFAVMQIVTRRVIDRIEPSAVNTLRLLMAVVAMQIFPEGRAVWSMPALLWLPAAVAGMLGPGLSRLALMSAVRYVSPSLTALVALVGPIFAFAFGALFFGESPSFADLAGAALIVAGVLWPLLPSLYRSVRNGQPLS